MKQTEIAWKCEFRHISIAILLFCSLFSTVFAVRTIDLAGQWQCELDRQDAGVDQKWFSRQLAETIKLPGTLQEQGFGDPITKDMIRAGICGPITRPSRSRTISVCRSGSSRSGITVGRPGISGR
jgi:hypothetical protein